MGADAFADECCTLETERVTEPGEVGSELPLIIAAVPVMLTSTMITQVRWNEAKVGTEDIDLVDPERARCQ